MKDAEDLGAAQGRGHRSARHRGESRLSFASSVSYASCLSCASSPNENHFQTSIGKQDDMMRETEQRACPVKPFDKADADYAEQVATWLANPNAYFRAFGPEARAFQSRNRSERLRTMTLVAPAAKLVAFRPVQISLDGVRERVTSWESLFAIVSARLIAAQPGVFAALQAAGELDWLGCPAESAPIADALAAGTLRPNFASLDEVVGRVQWLFLMCGIRLNEVIVQVDPYSDEEWKTRHAEILRKRADERAFMTGRRAAQKAWAEAHPDGF